MPERTLTARDMLRYQTCEQLLGCNQLTPEVRYQQAVVARRLRNFFFTATLPPRFGALSAPVDTRLLARTPTFSEPIVLTELLAVTDVGIGSPNETFIALEVFEYGGQGGNYGLAFFGTSGLLPQRYILKHEKNNSTATNWGGFGDLQSRYIGYVPRLLAPYQQLEFNWLNLQGGVDTIAATFLQAGLRSVRVIKADSPYAYFTRSADADIRNHINGSQPETFFMEAVLPFANFPAVGEAVQIKTPQQDRPLLIMGATCNVEGVQAALSDESQYYTFTQADDPIGKVPGIPLYNAPPLSLWASNADFRNYNSYHMWAVPHLLERGAQLVIKLTNGLVPTPMPGSAFSQTILTRSEQDARITFLCRTI